MNLTESDLLDQLIGKRGMATMLGWRTMHSRPARVLDKSASKGYSWRTPYQGDDGFPDWIAVKITPEGGRCIVAEFKRPGLHPRPEQAAWLDDFAEVEGCEAYLWLTDGDLDEIREILALGHPASAAEYLAWQSAWANRRKEWAGKKLTQQ